MKQVKLPVATTSESSQLPLSSSSPGCSETQPDDKWRLRGVGVEAQLVIRLDKKTPLCVSVKFGYFGLESEHCAL